MKLNNIANHPTSIGGKHESLLRSYHILQKVKEYLDDNVSHKIILEMIDELESSAPFDRNDTE